MDYLDDEGYACRQGAFYYTPICIIYYIILHQSHNLIIFSLSCTIQSFIPPIKSDMEK